MKWPRPYRSVTNYRRLQVVFSGQALDLVSRVLRLCILYEDLRLEFGELDFDAKPERNLYFLRRAIATLREFADAILRLDGLGNFQPLKARFTDFRRGRWNTAVASLREHKKRIDDERNAYGGHVAEGAVAKAFAQFRSEHEHGCEVHWCYADGQETTGLQFHFASEVMARVMLNGRPESGGDEQAYFRALMEFALAAFNDATDCVAIVGDQYVAPLFGF